MKRHLLGYAFISPWLIGFAVFTFVPFLVSIYLSFTRYNIVTDPVWVGAVNYKTLVARDPLFWKSLSITLKYAAVAVPLGIAAGVALALLLNLEIGGISLYRTVFFLPSIVPVVATSVIFVWILNPQIGLVNGLLRHIHLPAFHIGQFAIFSHAFGPIDYPGGPIIGPNWLGDQRWAFTSLVLMSLWAVGGSMVIYLAGLKDIPVQLYEAAMIDGASAWQRTRHITLPMLTPVIFFNLVMGTIGAFQYFTQAYVIMEGGGGPNDSTYFYALYLFNRAWRYLDMGYASAMAWILFVIVMVVTGLIFRSHRRWVHYGA
jgi:multiple sugar transport system permease protein